MSQQLSWLKSTKIWGQTKELSCLTNNKNPYLNSICHMENNHTTQLLCFRVRYRCKYRKIPSFVYSTRELDRGDQISTLSRQLNDFLLDSFLTCREFEGIGTCNSFFDMKSIMFKTCPGVVTSQVASTQLQGVLSGRGLAWSSLQGRFVTSGHFSMIQILFQEDYLVFLF